MSITREILAQYGDIVEEINEIHKDIKKTEDDIAKLIEEGVVIDKVKGGLGGIQGFKIEGFPEKEYNHRRELLQKKKSKLIKVENSLLEVEEEIEAFVETITISRDRRIFREIYLEGKTQQQVADEMYIDRSLVSKIISKYL